MDVLLCCVAVKIAVFLHHCSSNVASVIEKIIAKSPNGTNIPIFNYEVCKDSFTKSNICLCTNPHLQQYRIKRFLDCANKVRFSLTQYHTITGGLIFHTFPSSKSKPVLKRPLVSIIKLMWVAAELINHTGCNKSTPIPVLGRSHDLTP